MRLTEDFIDNIESSELVQTDELEQTNGWSLEDDCDIKILCCNDMNIETLDYEKYKMFLNRLKIILNAERYLTKCSEPVIRTYSHFYTESYGGLFPDFYLVDNKKPEYVTLTGFWIEFCCSTRFFNAKQVFRFFKSITDASILRNRIGPKRQVKSFYIYNRFATDKQFGNLKFMLPIKTVIQATNEIKLLVSFADFISPALMMSNRRVQAYDNIIKEAALNVLPKECRIFNEEFLKNGYFNTLENSNKILTGAKKSIAANELFKKDVNIWMKNVVYHKYESDMNNGDSIMKYGQNAEWEIELFERIAEVKQPRKVKFTFFKNTKELQVFAWLTTECLENSYIVGLNTYNIFIEIHGSYESLAKRDEFISTVCRVFPDVKENELRDALNKI